MFNYTYYLTMRLSNSNAPLFSSISYIITKAEKVTNTYYVNNLRVPNKKHLDVVINGDRLDVTLRTEHPLSRGREGNALRQFSVILLSLGLKSYISNTIPGKLLRRS